jgi:hypothetical protein
MPGVSGVERAVSRRDGADRDSPGLDRDGLREVEAADEPRVRISGLDGVSDEWRSVGDGDGN